MYLTPYHEWRESPVLGKRDVLIFRGRAARGEDLGQEARGWLSDAERGRYEGFRFDVDRRRYLHRTAFRRRVLGRLLGLEPRLVRFEVGEHGKPRLVPYPDRELHFSASHSGEEILLAVARREVGADIEERRALEDLEAVAERILHPAERAPWSRLGSEARVAAFYRLWCRKEAALKALGEGFTRPPATIRVGLEERPPGRPRLAGDPVLDAFGALADLAAPPGFTAAVCAAGEGWRTVSGTFPPP